MSELPDSSSTKTPIVHTATQEDKDSRKPEESSEERTIFLLERMALLGDATIDDIGGRINLSSESDVNKIKKNVSNEALRIALQHLPSETSESNEDQSYELTSEKKEETFRILSKRYRRCENLHKGQEDLQLYKVKGSIEEDPRFIWSIRQMEQAGHEPNIYHSDEFGFNVGTCSLDTPIDSSFCVFDNTALEHVRRSRKLSEREKKLASKRLNKNGAVEQAEAMGVKLMSEHHYLYVLGPKYDAGSHPHSGGNRLDQNDSCWLNTDINIRMSDRALMGTGGTNVCLRNVEDWSKNLGWRGSLRVPWIS